jgi:hypothetical protein
MNAQDALKGFVWVTKHATELLMLVPEIEAAMAAETYDEKWEAFKPAGDTLFLLIDDLHETFAHPAVAAMSAIEYAKAIEGAREQVAAAGIHPDKIGDNLPKIIDAIRNGLAPIGGLAGLIKLIMGLVSAMPKVASADE